MLTLRIPTFSRIRC